MLHRLPAIDHGCFGHFQSSARTIGRSVLPRGADIGAPAFQIRKVPCVDGSGLARTFFTYAGLGQCSHVFGL